MAEGFTLLEALVALTILGFVSMIAAGALHLAVETRSRVEARAVATQELRAGGMLLRSRLRDARPATWRWSSSGSPHWFHGRPKSVHFVASLPPRWDDGRLYLYSIEADNKRDGTRLILRYRPMPDDAATPVPADPEASFVLLNEIDGLSWSYYGRTEPEQAGRWRKTWDHSHLPQLVRLVVEPGTPRLGPWPGWTVSPAFHDMSAADVTARPRTYADDEE